LIKNPDTLPKKRWVIDAKGKVMGRLVTQAARLLSGKHKRDWSPNHDHGDFVIIINADKIAFTGTKKDDMRYFSHSTYPGGWRNLTYTQAVIKRPDYPVRHAIWGMLSHNSLGRKMVTKLHIYTGENHPHGAQKPELFNV